jgi:hypothetical protein
VADLSRFDPDNWVHDQALLDRPGNKDIQLDLFRDYGTNVTLYLQFQAFFRQRKPPALIVWGANDKIFPADGARAYLRDLPHAQLHLVDTGISRLRTSSMRWSPSSGISWIGTCAPDRCKARVWGRCRSPGQVAPNRFSKGPE